MAATAPTEEQTWTALRWIRMFDLEPREYDIEKLARSIARKKPATTEGIRLLVDLSRKKAA